MLGLIGWALGIDPRVSDWRAEILTGGGSSYQSPASDSSQPNARTGTPDDQMGQFVAALLGETEDRWKEIFQSSGKTYQAPKLVMFSGITRSACGAAQSAMGPFYCPNDQRVYLDTAFFRQIETRFRGCDVGSKACQFSQAYVIAHEVGHTSRTYWASCRRCSRCRQTSVRPKPIRYRCASSYRPIASRACGPIVRNRNGNSLSQRHRRRDADRISYW